MEYSAVVITVITGLIAYTETDMTDNPSVSSPLLGSWKAIGADYPLIDEYRADGTLVQRVGDRVTDPIAFRIEAQVLVYTLPQPNGRLFEQRERFELSGDSLTFIGSDGRKRRFERFGVGKAADARKPWWKFW